MKEWELLFVTTLPDRFTEDADLKKYAAVFDSFEAGKAAFQRILKHYAFEANEMFDGNGRITALDDYAAEPLEERIVNGLSKSQELPDALSCFSDALQTACSGEAVSIDDIPRRAGDGMICMEKKDGAITVYGEGNGPKFRIDPEIHTNIFDMHEEKAYYLDIRDQVRQVYPSRFYLALFPKPYYKSRQETFERRVKEIINGA